MKEVIKTDIRKLIEDIKKTAARIKRMRKLGASDQEISKALGISEEDLRII